MWQRLLDLERRHPGALLVLLLLAFAALAWSARFVLDDAFISFRYARNLVEGHGLVWQPGERVEGYTNFLWTLGLALPIALGLDPVLASQVAGIGLAVLTLLFTYRLATELLESRPLGLLTGLLLGTNPTFVAFATGGLETPLTACLVAAVAWYAVRVFRTRSLSIAEAAGLSLLLAAAVMTRLDTATIVGPLALAAAWVALSPERRRARLLAALVAPALLIVGSWLAWKLAYYGAVLPNTFHAKVAGPRAWGHGLDYLLVFFTSTLLAPFPFLVAFGVKRALREEPVVPLALVLPLLVFYAYTVSVGGDFMEFRLLVPSLSLLFALIVWSCTRVVRGTEARAALLLLVLAGSVHHAAFAFTRGIETTTALAAHLDDPREDWSGIGRRLGELFRDAPDVRIAVTAAGAIPYYSRLPTLDMLGLSDPWIPAHGIPLRWQAGHSRVAPLDYLVARGVHLVIAHPWVLGPWTAPERRPEVLGLRGFGYPIDVRAEDAERISILEIPLDGKRVLVVLYLTPHPTIERLAAKGRWKRFGLSLAADSL